MSGQEVIDLTADVLQQSLSAPGCSTEPTGPAQGTIRGRKRKGKAAAAAEADGEDGPPTKKSRAKKEKKDPPEKRIAFDGRTVRYSKSAPAPTRERIQRALPGSGHRMFLLTRKTLAQPDNEAGAAEEFEVLGATGNVYTVTVSKSPTCTCPDARRRGDLCKHYLYVMIRVLRLPPDDHLVWQRGLLTAEVNEVLTGQRSTRTVDSDVLAEAAVLEAHRRRCGGTPAGVAPAGVNGLVPGQRPIEGDCPICYDELLASQKEQIVFCKACGNNVHKECFQRWSTAKKGVGVTCVYCRQPWHTADVGGLPGEGGYVNLASHSAHHTGADTSLSALYGSNSVWIRAHAGEIGLRHAANISRAASGRR